MGVPLNRRIRSDRSCSPKMLETGWRVICIELGQGCKRMQRAVQPVASAAACGAFCSVTSLSQDPGGMEVTRVDGWAH